MASPPGPAVWLHGILFHLRAVIAARQPSAGAAAPVLGLLWSRLHRLSRRFAAAVARVEAGKLPRKRPARARAEVAEPRPAYPRLPQGFAWLHRAIPGAGSAGSQMQHFLAQPETVALLTAAPHLGRHLRPLCRMLGVPPPPLLRPAEPPARAKPAAPARRVARPPVPPVTSPPRRPGLAPPAPRAAAKSG